MDNISMETTEKPVSSQQKEETVSIFDVEIKDENTALNVLVQFLHIAQKRGAFNVQESAKLWEAISAFQKK
mgnify:FL=1|jgi:hypothetical protein